MGCNGRRYEERERGDEEKGGYEGREKYALVEERGDTSVRIETSGLFEPWIKTAVGG